VIRRENDATIVDVEILLATPIALGHQKQERLHENDREA
jgi:hypothetical protein